VAGVIPWLPLELPEEDAPFRHAAGAGPASFNIAVIAYPHLSNHDDIDPLAAEEKVSLRFVRSPEELQPADLVILPGSKHVAADLAWLRGQGFEEALMRHLRYGGRLLGICGGMQMLGQRIIDAGIEGASMQGLGLLPLSTEMQPDKVLRNVDTEARWPAPLRVTGYEIHHGRSEADEAIFPFAARSDDGQVWGSYLHGLFAQGPFRAAWLRAMGCETGDAVDHDGRVLASLDRLSDVLEAELGERWLAPLLQHRRAA
jgi:adenosylcobyric acid synthase